MKHTETIHYTVAPSSLGQVLVAQSSKGICAISISDDAEELCDDLQRRFPNAALERDDAELRGAAAKVVRFVERPTTALDIKMDIRGTEFQKRVWQALLEIPSGKTVSYTDIAQRVKDPTAVRAVAGACAANALAVAIPCHRVVKRDGRISGYRWGVQVKRRLLEAEGAL
jgi:AraC family transcriptional regulator of adaptative response/methylated-DNA-[protein]-cysteine methyltransferase